MDSLFFRKDKSGRGYTATVPLAALLEDTSDDTNDDDQTVAEWAAEAEVGDIWETAADYIIRTA